MSERTRANLRTSRSEFIVIKCKMCGNDQIAFSHPASEVRCASCNALLQSPAGGRGKLIEGEIVRKLE